MQVESCCPGERWVSLLEFPQYSVSTCGRVYSKHRGGHLLKPFPSGLTGNRMMVRIGRLNGNGKSRVVSQLVLKSFVGPMPIDKSMAHHTSNDFADNHLTNLEYVSTKEHYCQRHNLNRTGLRHRPLQYSGVLAAIFEVSSRNISLIVNRKSWTWLHDVG